METSLDDEALDDALDVPKAPSAAEVEALAVCSSCIKDCRSLESMERAWGACDAALDPPDGLEVPRNDVELVLELEADVVAALDAARSC